ncbi:hypothetical protein AJ78_06311 [Emergomyces pasteurianus Ep9510]|uniref:Uncharacterized protein n=1 Tax=Emergomyces pasteurianus Ep9510 TaxID=1447872 RepID=A0A1J9P9C5_9EURO|nr:hypothetical protein AJ78_06311 [Emergomyces pasteurianus Ep9510]
MYSDWNVYTLFNPSLRAAKPPWPSSPVNLPPSRPVPASHQPQPQPQPPPQPQPHCPILSTCNYLQTAPAPSISPQTLFYSLPPCPSPSPFSRLPHVPSFPPFKDSHEVQFRAEDTGLNDFDEFLAGLDVADLNPSLCVPIPCDADVGRSSRCLNDERHVFHDLLDGDEDRGLEKNDESLLNTSSAVACSLVRSTSTETLRGGGSSTPVLDSIPRAGLLKPRSDQDTFTADGSIVNSIFMSLIKQDTFSRATSVSHSSKTGDESDEASTGIAGEHSISLKRQCQLGVGISVMHLMVAVKVIGQAADFGLINERLMHDRGARLLISKTVSFMGNPCSVLKTTQSCSTQMARAHSLKIQMKTTVRAVKRMV